MKNYRALVPIVMIFLMAVSWYVLVDDALAVETEYTAFLTDARKYADDGITKYAVANYNRALEIKSTVEIYKEVAEYYKSQGLNEEYLSWCENFFEVYPTRKEAYDCILNAYVESKDYASCYDILDTAEKRNISSEYMENIRKDIEYAYRIDFNTYEDVRIYSSNYCPVATKGAWGFADSYGNQIIACRYLDVGAYTQSNIASVVNAEKEAYFIDKEGSKVKISKGDYESFGLLSENVIAAKKTDGKYTYVNSDLEALFGNYDYASTMNNGIAAVKTGDLWEIIDKSGKAVSDKKYADIIVDENQIASCNNRLFVAEEPEKYIMVDNSGKQIGSLVFEDAKPFVGTAPATVKIDGKWCFVDADGKKISDKTYDDARSFANGLAAVCIDGKWGFVDTGENIVIEPDFFGVKDFNEKGSCFVRTGDKWQLLKLYRLNREG